jgi:hypothetical protein
MIGDLFVLLLCAFMSWAWAALPCLSPCQDVPGWTKESQHSARCLVLCRTEDFCPLMVAWLTEFERARAGGRALSSQMPDIPRAGGRPVLP